MIAWLLSHGRQFLIGACALACLSLLAFAATYSESFGKCESERTEVHSKPNQSKLGEKVVTLFICEGEAIDANGELLTALGTLAIALFTLTLWNTSREQGRLTEIAIQDARISSQRELRAYVAPVPEKAYAFGSEFHVVVSIENTGQTPAFDTQCLWQLDVGPVPGTEHVGFAFNNPEENSIPTFVLYPGQKTTTVRKYAITSQDWERIEIGTHVIRAFGRVTYTDAFGDDQWGEFFAYGDKAGYELWRMNFRSGDGKPVTFPFKMSQGNNRASFI